MRERVAVFDRFRRGWVSREQNRRDVMNAVQMDTLRRSEEERQALKQKLRQAEDAVRKLPDDTEVSHYRLLLCKRCGWRWWSSSGETGSRIPDCCSKPDVWEVRSFRALDMGPGLHPKQMTS